MKLLFKNLVWIFIALLGAWALGIIAIERGESINAIWLIVAAVCIYFSSYRFYQRFIVKKILSVDSNRATPAYVNSDGKDYVPTNKWVVFGHHFAAIAGAGPLVGPVLAAQMGFLPGTLWIIIGVVFAGAVQDCIILFCSVRRNGKTLGEMIKLELGNRVGLIAKIGIILIMIILIAVLGLVVVKSLMHSPWGTFTVAMTIPIALFMGVYMRYLRPGRTVEVSIIGFFLLILALIAGQYVANHSYWSNIFNLKGTTIALFMIGYGFFASVLPVWLLLAPRDYLSTFLKIGVIFSLALSIIVVQPHLMMPSSTVFMNGTGPVFSGSLFPFLFITIACGAISGFHSLIASGTTPKLIQKEGEIGMIGSGSMLMESFVAVMAMIAACVLEPGIYFAINSPTAIVGIDLQQVSESIAQMGFTVTPQDLSNLASDVGEKSIVSRTGGAPTLAIGMAHIFQQFIGGKEAMAFWYHFAILFEALFILTTVDAGTRILRFMIQEILGNIKKPLGNTKSWIGNIIGTGLGVSGWGYFIYQGVIDPLGGINTLWPLFGLSNQILAVIALLLATTVLYKMGKKKYIWVTMIPMFAMMCITFIVSAEKVWHPNPKIGFLSHASKFSDAVNHNLLLEPAKNMEEMSQIIRNDYVNAILCIIFVVITTIVFIGALRVWRKVLKGENVPAQESLYIKMDNIFPNRGVTI